MGVERLAADVAEGEDLVAVGEGDDPRGGDLTDWLSVGFERRRKVFREFAGEGEGREQAVDLAAGADALDDLLAEIAALVEVQGLRLVGLLREVLLGDVAAVERAAFEEAQGFEGFGRDVDAPAGRRSRRRCLRGSRCSDAELERRAGVRAQQQDG